MPALDLKVNGPFHPINDGAKITQTAANLRKVLLELDRAEGVGMDVSVLREKVNHALAKLQAMHDTYIAPALQNHPV